MAIFNLSKRTLVLLLSLSSTFLGAAAEPDDANNSPTYAPSAASTTISSTTSTTFSPTSSPTDFIDPCQNCKDLHALYNGRNRCKRKCGDDEEIPMQPPCDDKCCKKICKKQHTAEQACIALGYCEEAAPTVSPTDPPPTEAPTDSPTFTPTGLPTIAPTITPQPTTTTSTLEPTVTPQPTIKVTVRPTRAVYDDWD